MQFFELNYPPDRSSMEKRVNVNSNSHLLLIDCRHIVISDIFQKMQAIQLISAEDDQQLSQLFIDPNRDPGGIEHIIESDSSKSDHEAPESNDLKVYKPRYLTRTASNNGQGRA